jgi:hypothetical protein
MAAGQGYDSSIAETPLDPGGWLRYPAAHAKSVVAQVAQLVEHATENRSVGGSIPLLGTIFFPKSKSDQVAAAVKCITAGPAICASTVTALALPPRASE